MKRYQELYGAREPSDEMKDSMHAHFHEQIRQVLRLQSAMQWYELSTDPPSTGMRTYQCLLLQVVSLIMRDREQWAISEHESTLNSRNRQARPTGGKHEGSGGGKKSFCHGSDNPTTRIARG
eukprot:6535266-Pyramimonas_sp.AAC.1